ncbi:hypothetical protein MTsPCn7_05840 [Altererythrobacter sp. MTPC7]
MGPMTFRYFTAAISLAVAALAAPAQAEVVEASDSGFTTRAGVVVEADTQAIWLALISPGGWWNDAHTWSGDASNMTLEPQAGGCFCERIPASEEDGAIGLDGSVRHMSVVQSFPRKVLRMRGGLGPLQGEPADGVLTITLKPVDGTTRILWEYVVGGHMRYEVPVIAKAVDGVMNQQLAGLASQFGGPVGAGGDTEEAASDDEDTASEDEAAADDEEGSADEPATAQDPPARATSAEDVAEALDALAAELED